MPSDLHDVIVVLGAAQNPDGSPGPAIMLCGGPTAIAKSEAETMAEVARAEGVAEPALLLEDLSTRTLENAEQCRRLMAEYGYTRALLVTDWFHMRRALYTFRAFGIDAMPDPVPTSWSGAVIGSLCREWVARLDYRWRVPRYLTERA